MNLLTNTIRLCGAFAIVCIMAMTVHAASVSATKTKTYGRFNFAFSEPARLKATVSGTTATLIFDKPVSASAESIRSSLPEYVSQASVSEDKKRVTLTLQQPYRIRQFVSGNAVGIDLVGAPSMADAAETPKPDTTPKSNTKPTNSAAKQPPAATPPRKVLVKTIPPKSEKTKVSSKATAKQDSKGVVRIPPTATAKAPEDQMLTTKADTPKKQEVANVSPANAQNTPAAVIADTQPESVLTTKESPPESVADLAVEVPKLAPTAAQSPAAEPSQESMLTTKSPPVEKIITGNEEPKAAEPSASVEKQQAPAEAEANKADQPAPPPAEKNAAFLVSAKTENGETTISFPWQERTGTAVFRRSRDIWIVFSRPKNINANLLKTIVPKQVINVTQYAYKGNTVIRLITDGSLHARGEQVKGGYGWNIILSANPTRPTLDVSMTADSLEGTTRLILGVFDIAPPVRFFDPTAGDLLTVIPSYENGRGVAIQRNFPEFMIAASNQGVAVISKVQDLTTSQTRSGLILSTKKGLSISESLPVLSGTTPIVGASATSGVMMPYDQWFVPRDKFLETLSRRLHAVAAATKSTKAESLFELVKLYLSEGMAAEASGILDILKSDHADYYVANKLALLHAASHILQNHYEDASAALLAPELTNLEEATLWRQVASLYRPPPTTAQVIQHTIETQSPLPGTDSVGNGTDASDASDLEPGGNATAAANAVATRPVFQLLKYNKPFIRFYPPRIRQRLVVIASEAYIKDDQPEKALAAYDTLVRDAIVDPVKLDAEYALGSVARKKGELDQAFEIFDRIGKQYTDPRVAAMSRYAVTKLRLENDKITPDEAAEVLENIRLVWRGDEIERSILADLVQLYRDNKRYDEVLRCYKAILDGFPEDHESLAIASEMSSLFQHIFLDGLADEMEPLKALSLFYEFRELTPLGERGDKIIQQLADRLASVDLIGRATQLLEHQIKFRTSGEQRSRVGARLALLHLLNKHPAEALSVLEVTNYGNNNHELNLQRQQLTAEALTRLGKHEEALSVLYNDTTPTGALLRLEVLWSMQDWPNIVNRAEDILSARPGLTDPLTPKETEVLLKLALAYTFESDYTQLRYLRDYYSNLIPDSAYKQIFDFITNDTTPLDPEDFTMIAQQISRTESFLDTFKSKIADGKLSDAIK